MGLMGAWRASAQEQEDWVCPDDTGISDVSWFPPMSDAETGVLFCVLCSAGLKVSTSILNFKAVELE